MFLVYLLFSLAFAGQPLFSHPDCEKKLIVHSYSIDDLTKKFLAFKYVPSTDTGSFEMVPRNSPEGSSVPVIHYQLETRGTSLLKSAVWTVDNRQYQFFDVGFKAFELDSIAINRIVANHILTFPTYSLRMNFSLGLKDLRERIIKYRWQIHSAVIDRYHQTKPYLKQIDEMLFYLPNQESNNYDVFGVLSDVRDINSISSKDIKENLALTLQISYFGARNFLHPELPEVLNSVGLEVGYNRSSLPFEYRLRSKERDAFMREFANFFKPKYVAELTRYAKFDKSLPVPIHHRLLYKAFKTATARGMRTLVASVDGKTERLFRQYGFRVFKQLPTNQRVEP